MPRWLRLMVLVILAVAGLLVLALFAWARLPSAARPLGVHDGALLPCPATPNCVTSVTGGAAPDFLLPPLEFAGSLDQTRDRLLAVVATMPRTTLVVADRTYLRAEFRSRLFGFVDDVEFLLDEASRRVHFRSASRLGRGDLGVNRARLLEIGRKYRGG